VTRRNASTLRRVSCCYMAVREAVIAEFEIA